MCRGYRKRSDFWIILFENVAALAKMFKCATTKRSVTYFLLGSGKCKLCAVFLVNPRVSLSFLSRHSSTITQAHRKTN